MTTPPPSGPARYLFADLTLDTGQQRLWRDGAVIALNKLPFTFLRVLVEAAPNLVTHDELASRVWGPRRVVTPENLAQHALMLRRALNDDAARPRYFESVRGAGYRLIPTVHAAGAAADTVPDSDEGPVGVVSAGVVLESGTAFEREQHNGARPKRLSRLHIPAIGYLTGGLLLAMCAWLVMRGDEVTDVQSGLDTRHSIEGPPATPARVATIAVLPFASISPDPNDEYFADGLTTELMTTLARIKNLRVTGRTSSFHFKGKNTDLRSVGEMLDVEHVVEGSVRRDDVLIRITAQLIDVPSGYLRWSRTYDRKLDDVLSIQDEIAGAVADALEVSLGVGELGGRRGMTRNLAAYDEYLVGVSNKHQSDIEHRRATIDHLERAVGLDPEFARAWADLSVAYRLSGSTGPAEERAVWTPRAAHALESALAIAPDSTYARAVEAQQTAQAWGDWRTAGQMYRALFEAANDSALEPGVTELYGRFLLLTGRPAQATAMLERAKATEPLDILIAADLVFAYSNSGNSAAALRELARAEALLAAMNRDDAATAGAQARMLLALSSNDRTAIVGLLEKADARAPVAFAMRRLMHDPIAARRELARLASDPSNQSALTLGFIAAWAGRLGDPSLALDVLRRPAFSSGVAWRPLTLVWQPMMRDVRKLPGFKTLMEGIGLVAHWRESGWPEFCSPTTQSSEDFTCG